jgi:hypothetical protein
MTGGCKDAQYTIAIADNLKHFNNHGASGQVDFTLPTAVANLQYCDTVAAAQPLKLDRRDRRSIA